MHTPCYPGTMWVVKSRRDRLSKWKVVFYSFYREFADHVAQRLELYGSEAKVSQQPYDPKCIEADE